VDLVAAERAEVGSRESIANQFNTLKIFFTIIVP
jgi:hypothetical protein